MGFFGDEGYADDGPYIQTKHNETCRELGEKAKNARPEAQIWVDHCAWSEGVPTVREGSYCGNRYRPDFELREGNYRVIGEVETVKGLNGHTLAQLRGIRTPGFLPLVVFPRDEIREGRRWVEDQGLDWATVETPKGAAKLFKKPGFFERFFSRF